MATELTQMDAQTSHLEEEGLHHEHGGMSPQRDTEAPEQALPSIPRTSQRTKKFSEKGAAYVYEQTLRKCRHLASYLTNKQRNLLNLISARTESSDLQSIKSDYISVMKVYEDFINQYELCEKLSPEEDYEQQKQQYDDVNKSFIEFKTQIQQWLMEQEQTVAVSGMQQQDEVQQQGVQQDHIRQVLDTVNFNDSVSQTSVGRSISNVSQHSKRSRCSIISARVVEEHRKKEILAKAHALKEKREIEQKKRLLLKAERELREREEDLEIKKQLIINSAKAEALEDLERQYMSRDIDDVSIDTSVFKTPKQSTDKLSFDKLNFSKQHSVKPEQGKKTQRHNPSALVGASLPSRSEKRTVKKEYEHSASADLLSVTKELRKPTPEISKFSGNAMEYTSFLRQFNARINVNTDSYDERLNYLLQFTTGEAYKIVCGYSHLTAEVGYTAALEEFKDRYGDPEVVAQAYVKKALEWPAVKSDHPKTLDEFAIFLRECQFAVETIESARVLEYSENLKLLVRKLPYQLHDRWRNIVYSTKEKGGVVKFREFVDFVRREAKKANDPTFGRIEMSKLESTLKSNKKQNSKPSKTQIPQKTFAISVNETDKMVDQQQSIATESEPVVFVKPCLYCQGKSHSLDICRNIMGKPLKERYEFLRSKGLCFGCLKSGHLRSSCRQKQKCSTCNRYHPSILHVQPREEKSATVTSTNDMGAGVNQALSIVPVRVKHTGSDKFVVTYAFLDNGSTATFCTEQLMRKLNIDGCRTKLNLHTMVEDCKSDCFMVKGLEICGLNGEHTVELPPVFTQHKLPVSTSDVVNHDNLKRWPYLQKVPLHRINSGVDLLIGVNVPSVLQPWDVIPSQGNGPYAVKTIFGWVINGPMGIIDCKDSTKPDSFASVNHIMVTEEPTLEEQLHRQFNHDFPERTVDDVPELSREERQFLHIVEKSAHLKNGHFVINLPFRDSNVTMPNNKKQAEQRMMLLGNRLARDEDLYQDYKDFMDGIISKGYAKAVPNDCLGQNDGKVWYLPHHGVYHPQKKKLRVVFDCAAKYKGISLNDHLLKGPNLTNTLVGTLLRFRQDRVAVIGDIESMFYQVQIPEEQYSYLRFLWWQDGNISKPMKEYNMVVHLFGATSSPSVCNFALKRAAQLADGQYNEDIIDTVHRSFYVDDCLKSVTSVEQAKCLVEDLTSVLKGGGFHIAKWMSNSREVMSSIPPANRAKEVKNMDLDRDSLPVERALGVQWNAETDMFEFKISMKEKPPTRRGILSMVSSIYDPLGFLAPAVLQVKCLQQELCRLGLGWDETLPQHLESCWNQWLTEVHRLSDFKIARCLKTNDLQNLETVELHHFSDASESGYGVATYLRTKDCNNKVHVALVCGKARVTPLKKVTMPRLELTAATIAVKTDCLLKRELTLTVAASYFWTDSMSVLRYIGNETSRFHTFVANRLTIIHEGSQISEWKYIPSKLNPADKASRGMSIAEFIIDKQWVHGPDFLRQTEEKWPKQCTFLSELSDDDPEVKRKIVAVNSVKEVETDSMTQNSDPILKLANHYSSWYFLKRAIALLIRVRANLLCRTRQKRVNNDSSIIVKEIPLLSKLTVQELHDAENVLIQNCQLQSFSSEIDMLKRGQAVKSKSSIKALDPYLDNGLLRVGGRISRARMPEERKHPVLLPKHNRVTRLILEQIHKDMGHMGRNCVLSRLQERYWVIGASSAIRKMLSDCVICRRWKPKAGQQKMADLLEDRLLPNEPPFTRTGMDYFGPFNVKQKRSQVKRYGVVFTCLNCRAIHLEVADKLDTSSCINAIRRFFARRGQCHKIFSDNGTNLVGASRELKESLNEWNTSRIHDSMLQHGIDWEFNPPSASHFGGIWERMIRSVRQVLYSVLREQILDDEGLRTIMCEVESILNDRPITKISDRCGDLEALTPNHLLLLKRNPVLPPGCFNKGDSYSSHRWRQVQYMANLFWKRWVREYLPLLQARQKWFQPHRNLTIGDVVLIVDNRVPRGSWPLGRVVKTLPDRHGLVRRVYLKTQTNVLERPVHKLCLLLEAENN